MRQKLISTVLFILFAASEAFAQGSSFTYQGSLKDGGNAPTAQYDFTFRLYSVVAGGSQIGGDVLRDDVQVAAGIFTVNLDFGTSPFTSVAGNYLEIAVRPGASTGAYTMLVPRQPITSSPFSIKTVNASSADSLSAVCVLCVTDAHIVALDGSKVTGTVNNAATANNVSGVVPIANGGTGSSTQNFVDTTTGQFISGNKTFLGQVTAAFGGTFAGNGSGLTNVRGTFVWQGVFGTSQQTEPNTGYMASAAGQVTFTLPPSSGLNYGDTVRVSGAGEGGWKIAQNAGQSIFGANLTFLSANWMARETNRTWQSIASSADGNKLVAVAWPSNIYTSADSGATWTARESIRDWFRVASSSDGTKLVALVANSNFIYTSGDSGVSWTTREMVGRFGSVASSADGSKLVAGVYGGQIYTSTDSGASWTARDSSRQWSAFASSADGSKLAAVAASGIYTSTNSGVTWTLRNALSFWSSIASSADGSKLVAAVDQGQLYTSIDSGATWTARESNRRWYSVASSADGGKLAAVGGGINIYTSTDSGVTWQPQESGRSWNSIASSSDGNKLAAVVNGGQIYTSVRNTTTGTAGYLVGEQGSAIELQYIGNGQFMPISFVGTIRGF